MRAPLWVVLAALVLPPVGGVAFLSRREIGDREQTAAVARDVVELTTAFVAAADLRSALSNEQMYASAISALKVPGAEIDQAMVSKVLGSDLPAHWRDMAAATDAAFIRADEVLLRPSLAGAGPLSPELAQRIATGRDGVRALGSDLATLSVGFDEVSARYGRWGAANREALDAMADTLAGTASQLAGAQGIARQVEAVRRQVALSSTMSVEVTRSASLILGKLLDVSLGSGTDEAKLRADLIETAARRDVGVAELEELLDPSLLETWNRVRSDPHVISFETKVDALGRATSGTDPVPVAEVPQLARDGLDRLDMHNALLPMLLRDVARTADAAHATAVARRDETAHLGELLVGGTLALLSLAVFAVTRPLRRLRKRAREVRDGRLEAPARVGSVIADLHDVQLVFEDIVSNFRVIEAQATAIVEGRLEGTEATMRPGPFGRSVQESLGRLAAVTRQLQTSEAMSNAIVETAAEAIWVLDARGAIIRANAAAEHVTLVEGEDAVGRRFLDLVDPVDRPVLDTMLAAGDLDSVEVRLRRSPSVSVPVLLSSSRIVVEGDEVVTVIGRDITERKDLELRLEHNAATDSLTGLPNRRTAVTHLDEALDRVRDGAVEGVGVVFCDLDGFKQANDVHGHHFGDDVLREVARRFRGVVRDGEVLARLGGDEFIVVATAAQGLEDVNRLAGRLLDSLQDTVVVGDRRVRINGSFGVAWSRGGVTTSDLLREADVAMFTAKAGGGGQVQLFDDELQQSLRARVDIEAGLRKALRDDELYFVYQPIVAAGTHEVVGVEALVRWERPGRGSVSPAIFIPVAEQSDLVIEIGRWGLRAAARQLVEWEALLAGREFSVAVNVAGVHLSRYDIVADVRAALEEFDVDPHRFRIEITETQLVDDLDVAAEAMRGLAELGIPVVIDDYGTGFSSIAYLRQLPVHGIKIDRSFITQLENERDRAMVESLVILAGLLDLEVTAEGVETEQQLLRSEQIGCDHVQGYLMSRPVPAAHIADRLQRTAGALRLADIAHD